MKFVSKPVVIEAFRLGIDNYPDWFIAKPISLDETTNEFHSLIRTLEGNMKANEGDWIIKGTEGELYPCKDSVFRKKYVQIFDQGDQ